MAIQVAYIYAFLKSNNIQRDKVMKIQTRKLKVPDLTLTPDLILMTKSLKRQQ